MTDKYVKRQSTASVIRIMLIKSITREVQVKTGTDGTSTLGKVCWSL